MHTQFHGRLAPAAARRGIYVSEFFLTADNIVGFRRNGDGPICYDSTGSNAGDIVTDAGGHLIVAGGSSGVSVYEGPAMCGRLFGTITYAAAGSTAAAIDAVNGPIFIGATNGVAVCDLSENECTPLKSPHLSAAAGVAMDRKGNCYADGIDSSGSAGLWIYRKCERTGKELTSANGFSEPYEGGITADNRGNLVVVSLYNASFSTPSTVTVYSGCITGTCTIVGGPFSLQGQGAFAHLNITNDRLVTANLSDSLIDIYAYGGHGTKLTYLYSFDNGLSCASNFCIGATYSPSSPK